MKCMIKAVVVAALALVARDAFAAESLVSEGAQPVVARLDMEVAREGKAAEECAIVTRSGHEGEFKKVTEYIYPTKFNVVVSGTNGVFSDAVEPDGYTMREVGFKASAITDK